MCLCTSREAMNCTKPFIFRISGAGKERKTVILLHVYYSKIISNWLSYKAQEKIWSRYSTFGIFTPLFPASCHL